MGAAHLDQPVKELALHGDSLWIGGRNLARLNLQTREVQLFAHQEIGLDQGWTFWQRFLFDGPYVWVHAADSAYRAYRLDTRNGSWSVLSDPETGQQLPLIGLVDSILWTCIPGMQRSQLGGIVSGNGNLAPRPESLENSGLAQIDETTLALKPVQVLTSGLIFSAPACYTGRFEGKAVFGGWFYDPATSILRPVPNQAQVTPDDALPNQLGRYGCWQRPDGVATGKTSGFEISFLKLPDGTTVLAKRDGVAEYLWNREHYDSSFPYPRDAGAWFGNGISQFRHLSMQYPDGPSASVFFDALPSDFVH